MREGEDGERGGVVGASGRDRWVKGMDGIMRNGSVCALGRLYVCAGMFRGIIRT